MQQRQFAALYASRGCAKSKLLKPGRGALRCYVDSHRCQNGEEVVSLVSRIRDYANKLRRRGNISACFGLVFASAHACCSSKHISIPPRSCYPRYIQDFFGMINDINSHMF